MKHFAAVLIGFVASCIIAMPAQAGDVCAYTVTSGFGVGCPIHAAATACIAVSAVTGPCNAALDCVGRTPFLCRVTLVPKSGPQAQCPAASKRLTGFSCFAPQRLLPTRTATPRPTPTATPGTLPPTFLDQRAFRADDGTAYQVVSLGDGSADVRITTLAGSVGGVGVCQMTPAAIPGQPVSAVAGVLPPAVALHPFDLVVRTFVLTPNDLSSITFNSTFGGRLVLGTGAGALNVCAMSFDCTGQPNVQPIVGLDSVTGGVPAACVANGLSAGCDGTNLRNAFAFGLASSGSPPVCTSPSAVTVDTTLCAPSPTDGFTLHHGEAIVFMYGDLQGLGFSAGVAGLGISAAPVGVCTSGGVIGSTSRVDASP
jgi:hypothetical protein